MKDNSSLVIFTKASQMLAEANTIQKLKELKNIALTAADWAKRKKMGEEAVLLANGYALEAEKKMGQMLKESELHKGGRPSLTGYSSEPVKKTSGVTQGNPTPTLKELGISKKDSSNSQKLADMDTELFTEIKEGKKSKTKAIGEIKNAERRAEIQKIKEDIKNNKTKSVDGNFEVIVIDPPWQYNTSDDAGYNSESFRGTTPYPTMTIEQIKNIKIPASKDSVIWLWTTQKHMRYAFDILDSWGFVDKAILTWVKNKMGIGKWLRSKSEFCIMAVKGKPIINLTNQTTVLEANVREHSRKPDEFYAMVDNLCVGRKLDYFSREKRDGWGTYGVENDKF